MRKFDEMNAGRFLRAADFAPGESFAVTVTGVRDEEIGWGDDKELMLILSLAHRPGGKPWGDLIPNLSNRKILARNYGNDPEGLIGQQLTVVIVITGFEGRSGFQVQPVVQPKAPPRLLTEPPSAPAPAPGVAPAANTRPRRGRPPTGNSPKVPDLDDEIPY
jgi:hypothetical protein